MKDINQRIANLSPEKRAILEQRLKEKNAETQQQQTIPKQSRIAPLPLSFSQQRMWLLDRIDPGNPAYNRPTNLSLIGKLDISTLEKSLNEIVHRHEVLRTSFSIIDEKPVQIIASQLTITLPIIDFTKLSEEDQKAEIQKLTQQEAQETFDLTQCPLFRVKLIKLSSENNLLLLTFHHIIFDGWSAEIFKQDLAEIYQGFLTKNQSKIKDLPIQYADFACWQRQQMQGKKLQEQLAYWKRQLSGELPILELPADRRRPLIQTFKGAKQSILLSSALTQALKALSHQEGVTLFMTLLAAFKVLLYRYTNQKDIIIGSPIAGRDRLEIEKLIGVFINTLVLRTQLRSHLTFKQLLIQVKKIALEAYAHKELPFETLVEELKPERNLNHTPLFQVLFQFRNIPQEIIQIKNLKFQYHKLDRGVTAFDLSLDIFEQNKGLLCQFEYNTDLFNPDRITRMMEHFQVLLEGIVADPTQTLSKLPLLTESERHQLLVEWNNTQTDYPKELCIHQLFEKQVKKTPYAVAVVFEDQQLTYQQLNQKANQLAHYLIQLGITPDTLVGICVERSLEMVIGLLGLLKAGGAYVPIDPNYPQERISYLLDNSQVKLLLTQNHLLQTLPEYNRLTVCLDSDLEKITVESDNNPVIKLRSNHLIYVIYTSGSTGKPKGTMNTHKGVVNRILWMQDEYQLTESDKVLQKTPFSFDVSGWEFWWPLITGAELIIAKPEGHKDPNYLAELINQQQITTLHFVPSMLQIFLEYAEVKSCQSLRQVFCSGEALSVALQNRFFEYFEAELHNLYGPTEAAIDVTFWRCQPNLQQSTVPIGRPVANTQTYILNSDLQPVPVGVAGELYIGGDGLARGYLNRPELTTDKFISNPFGSGRLYKTGDLACYLPDGNIEFIGRIDHQVKIRGFRIELGEIETVLSQHPDIKETVVMAREDQPGKKRLVAYWISQTSSLTTIQLRSFLKSRLPEYMIPAVFVKLEAFPLTPNGKIDRRALPVPDAEALSSSEAYVAPQTPTQKQLAAIWSEVLSLEKISIDENFFELGGHSLLATQVMSRVQKTLTIEMPLQSLFESPTVAELAETIEQLTAQNTHSSLPTIVAVSRENRRRKRYAEDVFVFPTSSAQKRLWLIDRLEPNSANYNISRAYRLKGILNITALQQAITTVVQRHETLRTTFAIEKGSPVQIIAADGNVDLSIIDLTTLSESEQSTQVKDLINQKAQQPFNLTEGPLLRITLLQLSQESDVLLLTIHHIISDGWSMGILIKELSTLYTAFSKGEIPSLEPLSIQYADFTLWQRDWLTGEVLDTQLNYWKQQLADIPPLLELPTDHHRPSVPSYQGSVEHFQLSAQLTEQLKALSLECGTTLFMTLLAAFAALLYRYSGQTDVVIGSPIANRNRPENEPLIGFFVNTLVLRTRCEGNPSFHQLLTQVKQVCLDAYAHQDIPFEKLVEELNPERHLSHTPLFQVMFVLQNTSEQQWELPDIGVTPVEIERNTAKFDLLLSLKETATGIIGRWEYSQDLFEAATITRMMGHFQVLLEGIIAHPTQLISKLPLLTASEQHQLLVEWNETQADYPKELCIHQLFEQQVKKTPDAVAVVFEEQQLTYQELNQKANKLAYYLQELGVKPEVLVGICVERSIEMIVGILAILKAGGAYVPLDPDYPKERLAFMLEDTKLSVLLTQKKLREKLPQHQAQVICLDIDWEIISQECSENIMSDVKPENLAYVIYTSGSTGTPKGVAMTHLPLVNLIWWQLENFTVSNQATTLQFTPISFDVSFQEIFSTFCSGGKLVLISQENRQNPEALLDYLIAKKIQRLFLPFVALQQLAQAVEHLDRIPTYLCEVMTAGEQLQISPSVAQLFNHLPNCTLHNHYGPSESHVVTAFTLSYPPSSWFVLPPIGRPIANSQIYILNPHLQPVPIGVAGELYIGGDGLARGYLNRPQLTAEKFIANPFGSGRLYKTGDQARYLPDGNIEFIGRIDNQVKIRGFRIELGEIETVLSQHPDVEETIVIVQEYQPEDQRLIAYVVPNQKQVPTFLELRQFLKQRLPEYMIPATFVPLEALPLTPNGKLNRHALPAPNWGEHNLEIYIAPRNQVEKKLAEIWAEVLWLEQPVGIHNNFFELGGHSLLSVKLVAEIEKAFQTKLPLKALFQLSTIAELATFLDNKTEVEPTQTKVKKTSITPQLDPEIYHQLLAFTAGWKGDRVTPESLIIGVNTQGDRPALFWCFQGFRELSQLAKYMGLQYPIYGMRSGHLIMEYTKENIQALAAHYVREILSIQPEGSYRLGGNCQSGIIMFEIAQQLQQQGKTVAILCLLEAFIPKPYFGEVALFFGQESDRFNPYKTFAQPELGYCKFYRGGFSINIISGDHGQYFNEPHIQVFARKLRDTLDRVQTDESIILKEEAYQAQLKGVSSLTAQAGEILSLVVTVKNISSVTWLATKKSAIFLANHWLDKEGEIIQWLDGRVDLSQDLQPQATVELNLSVTTPIEPGLYHLELDLVEEGVTWFKDKKSETMTIQVEVTALENTMIYPSSSVHLSEEKCLGYLEVEENYESSNSSIQMAEDIQDCQKGKDRFEKGDFFSAIKFYQKAINSNPNQSFEVYFQLGKAWGATGKVSEAIACYQKVIELQPNFADVYWHLGQLQSQQGQLDDAIANYKKSLNITPDLVWIYPLLAEALIQSQQLEEAISVYQTALEFQDYDSQIYSRLGNLNLKIGNLEEAYLNYNKALELQPDSVHLYNSLGNILLKKCDLEAAIAVCEQSIQLNPKQTVAYTILGNAFNQKEEYNQAIAFYQKAIQFQSNNPNSHIYFLLGNAFRQIEDFKSAIDAYQTALTLNPKNAFGIYRNLAESFKQDQQIQDAIDTYKKALELQPENQNIRRIINQLKQN